MAGGTNEPGLLGSGGCQVSEREAGFARSGSFGGTLSAGDGLGCTPGLRFYDIVWRWLVGDAASLVVAGLVASCR
jgi:hypothetical protein